MYCLFDNITQKKLTDCFGEFLLFTIFFTRLIIDFTNNTLQLRHAERNKVRVAQSKYPAKSFLSTIATYCNKHNYRRSVPFRGILRLRSG